MKENKGITLVALIITIIVMLILVGVTISAVVQSDIIGQGEEAARAYENKQTEEQSLNFITEEGKTIANYLNPSNEDEEVPDELKLYLFGESGTGKPEPEELIENGSDIISGENVTFITGSRDKDNDGDYYYIKYKNMIYRFKEDEDYNTDASYGVQKIGEPIVATSTSTPEVGSTISYDGKKWVVMYIKRN